MGGIWKAFEEGHGECMRARQPQGVGRRWKSCVDVVYAGSHRPVFEAAWLGPWCVNTDSYSKQTRNRRASRRRLFLQGATS